MGKIMNVNAMMAVMVVLGWCLFQFWVSTEEMKQQFDDERSNRKLHIIEMREYYVPLHNISIVRLITRYRFGLS